MRDIIVKLLTSICRFGLAALFLFAVGAKLYFINNPEQSFLTNMPNLVGERFALPVASAVIAAELFTVILLLIPKTVRIGAILAGLLLLVFAGYALYFRYVLGNVEGLECGCFGGIIASQLGFSTALRNLILLIPALVVIFGYKRQGKHRNVLLEGENSFN